MGSRRLTRGPLAIRDVTLGGVRDHFAGVAGWCCHTEGKGWPNAPAVRVNQDVKRRRFLSNLFGIGQSTVKSAEFGRLVDAIQTLQDGGSTCENALSYAKLFCRVPGNSRICALGWTHALDQLKIGSQVLVPRWWRRVGEVFSPEPSADGRLARAMMWRLFADVTSHFARCEMVKKPLAARDHASHCAIAAVNAARVC